MRPQRLWVSGDLGQTQLLRGLQPGELIYHSFSIQALILLHPQTPSTTAPASGSLAEDVTLTTGPCFSDPVPCPAAAGQCQGLLYSKLHPIPCPLLQSRSVSAALEMSHTLALCASSKDGKQESLLLFSKNITNQRKETKPVTRTTD